MVRVRIYAELAALVERQVERIAQLEAEMAELRRWMGQDLAELVKAAVVGLAA